MFEGCYILYGSNGQRTYYNYFYSVLFHSVMFYREEVLQATEEINIREARSYLTMCT